MIAKIVAAGFIALTTLATAAPAAAAGFTFEAGAGKARLVLEAGHRGHDRWQHHGQRRMLGTHELRRALNRQGYRHIRHVNRRGAVLQVRAVDFRGRNVGLVVSARSGAVLNAYRLR